MTPQSTPEIDLDTSLAVSAHVLAQEFDGAKTMMNTHSEEYFSLDGVGKRMWDVIVQTQTLREAHTELLEEFEVTPAQLEDDLLALAAELVASGLMVVADRPVDHGTSS